MGDPEQQGQEMMDKAEKKLQKWFTLGNKWDDAQELFSNAAAKFKVAKSWKNAGKALMRVSDCATKSDSKFDSAQSLADAAACFKKADDTKSAIMCLERAVELYIDLGRFTSAAKHEYEMGEILREDLNYDDAIKHYKKASEYHFAEDQASGATKCLVAIADLYTELERFSEAMDQYEQIAKSYQGNKMMTYQVKDYLFKAMLVALANVKNSPTLNLQIAKDKFEMYQGMDAHFASGRDYELLADLIPAVEEGNEEAFSQAIGNYTQVAKLDDWKSNVLVRI